MRSARGLRRPGGAELPATLGGGGPGGQCSRPGEGRGGLGGSSRGAGAALCRPRTRGGDPAGLGALAAARARTQNCASARPPAAEVSGPPPPREFRAPARLLALPAGGVCTAPPGLSLVGPRTRAFVSGGLRGPARPTPAALNVRAWGRNPPGHLPLCLRNRLGVSNSLLGSVTFFF